MVSKYFSSLFIGILFLSTQGMATEQISTTLKGSDGLPSSHIKAFIDKLKDIGYENVNNNENIQDAYFKKYNEKKLDYLSFFTITNENTMRKLLLAYPQYGAFSPFNFLTYKSQDDNKTWYGNLEPQAILNIVGDKDPTRVATYKKMHAELNTLVGKEMKPKYTKKITYESLTKKPMLEMIMTFKRPKDLSNFIEEFQDTHDEAFEEAEFIIVGYIDFKEAYTDTKLAFNRYDAYWVSSLDHFTFYNAIFNRSDPQAGIFAPCSVYFYIEKGSNRLHVGMATVENWIAMSGVEDSAKIKMMKEIDEEIIDVFRKIGFRLEGEETKVGTVATTPISTKNKASTKIKHGPKYLAGKVTETAPAYLIGKVSSAEDIKSKLNSNGFEILSSYSIMEGQDVISVTNNELKKSSGFTSAINVLINNNGGEVRIQNPDYLARAYLGKEYKNGMFDSTITSLANALGELNCSLELQKIDDLSDYHFMAGMPYFADSIEIASGDKLVSKAKADDTVAYTLLLPDASTLIGHKLSKRTSKFLKKINVEQNAGLLPYTVPIKENRAKMLDPKYYLALSLPGLSMSEFMKIASIPDSIKKELGKVYK